MKDPKRAFRRELLIGLAWGIPFSIVAHFIAQWLGILSDNVWGVVAALVPLAVVTWFLARPIFKERRVVLGGGFLPFFLCYVLLFSLAATTEVLNGKRVPLLGYEDAVPRNFLGLGWIEDWHYLANRRAAAAENITVVLLPTFTNVNESRLRFSSLIKNATDLGARGIAFDYFLEDESNVDAVLCTTVRQANNAGVKVLFGYRLMEEGGELIRRPIAQRVETCVGESQLGSLAGYRESDGVIRLVPLFVSRDPTRPALSYRIATALDPDVLSQGPALLQFNEPRSMPIVDTTEMVGPSDAQLFRDRFVIVGSGRAGDRHVTPYGPLPGVVIHAYTSHSLVTGEFIRRLDHRWTFPIIFLICFVLVGIQARGGRMKLLIAAGAFVFATVVGCAIAMFAARLWIDASYPIVAVVGLTVLLQGGAVAQANRLAPRITRSMQRVSVDEAAKDEEIFDVFLSHNGEDKEAVRQLADALVERNIRVWLDERELPPGKPWQEEIERVIETVRSAAILVGPHGMGPWEIVEMRASLEEVVRRGLPVIPVLLPGTPEEPELPLFLRRHTWVDVRDGLSQDGVDRIEWGITGVKPARRARLPSGSTSV